MLVLAPGGSTAATATPTPTAPAAPTPSPNSDALAVWDDNGNGQITCAEARAHGIGEGIYDYVVGVYYPNEKQLASGAKAKNARRITW